MRQEFGRWFLDVAKYILTALLLSSFFGEMNNIYYTILAFCIFALCLLVGALLLKGKDYDKTIDSRSDGRFRNNSGPRHNKKRRKGPNAYKTLNTEPRTTS